MQNLYYSRRLSKHLGGERLKVYITLAGGAEWALINSLWASIREQDYTPDKVFICSTKKNLEGATRNKERIASLLEGHDKKADISIVEIPENDFVVIGNKVADLIKGEKDAGNEVALDITSARKAIASPALIVADKYKADHIFYLYIENVTNADRPYLMIPLGIQHPTDFLRGGEK
jgi:hypothetical protein